MVARSMPVGVKSKRVQPNQETWVDWMPEGAPEPELRSHDELIHELHERGIDITPTTLEYWRRKGILPRPVRRRHAGATRPVYPEWFVPAIEHLKKLQAAGKSLNDICPLMQSWARIPVQWNDPRAELIATTRAALTALASAYGCQAGVMDRSEREQVEHELAGLVGHVFPMLQVSIRPSVSDQDMEGQ